MNELQFEEVCAIYKFDSYGEGEVFDGIFLATPSEINQMIGKDIHFGEDIRELAEENISFVTDDPEVVDMFVRYDMACGVDPTQLYYEDEDGQPDDYTEHQDFAQDGEFENMSAEDIL